RVKWSPGDARVGRESLTRFPLHHRQTCSVSAGESHFYRYTFGCGAKPRQPVGWRLIRLHSSRLSHGFSPDVYNPASILDLGSSKSRNASPIKLKESTASMTAVAGKITRCGASNKCPRPSLSIAPQEAVGGGTPRPRKLIVASARMAPAIPIAACTMTG